MKNKKEMFSLSKHYKGKCNTVGLVVKDVLVDKEPAAMLFISLTFNKKLIEAQVPLDDVKDFKRHILAIITEASELKPKAKKKDGK